MSNEELERAIEFLLKNQAAFEANLAADREAFRESQEASKAEHERLSANQDRTQRQLDHLSNVVAHIAEITQRNSEEIDALVKLVGGVIERGNGKSEN